MDTRDISPRALELMLAMTVPMQHLRWVMDEHGGVNPYPLTVDLPGKPFNRLDPGRGYGPDDEICRRIMVFEPGRDVLAFPPGILERLEHERRKRE